MSTRALRPRAPIAVAPLAVSTETCLQVGGIVPRKFREALAAFPDIPRSKIGHTLLVSASDFYALLERLRVSGDDEAAPDAGDDQSEDGQPTSIDDVLRAVGKERVR